MPRFTPFLDFWQHARQDFYRPPPQQIADDDPVSMASLDRDFINPDHHWPRYADAPQLLSHVLLVELLDRLPIQRQLFCHVLERRHAAPPTDIRRKPLRVKGVARNPGKSLLLHRTTSFAENTPDLHFQIDPGIPTGEIPNLAHLAVVKAPMQKTACAADCFFPRRRSRRIRVFGSPKQPRT